MQLACLALAHFTTLSCKSGSFSQCSNPRCSPRSALSLSFPFSQPCSHGPLPCCRFSPTARFTHLVGLADCFFNSLVVRVPCSFIFWHCRLFIDFRCVVILLLVVRGSEGFVHMPPSWLGLPLLLFFWKPQALSFLSLSTYCCVYLKLSPSWSLNNCLLS